MRTNLIETIKLRDRYYARPKGTLGTCGWSPFAWTLTGGRTEAEAIRNFKENHRDKNS